MPVKLSYINARDEEIVLDDDEHSFAYELTGRTGFEMPQIETENVVYGDGSQDIILSKMKSRTVTCYFWVDLDNKVEFERHFREVKSQLMQVGSQKSGRWGRLKIRQTDGSYVYLNCIYKSGFDSMVRDSNVRLKFSLAFEATDPLFYNGFESVYTIKAPDDAEYLMMLPLNNVTTDDEYDFAKDNIDDNPDGIYMKELTFEDDVYNFAKDNSEDNPDGLYMSSAAAISNNELELDCQKVYPTITITGTAGNIRIYNELSNKKIEIDSSVEVSGSSYILIETKPLKRKAVLVDVLTGAETNILSSLSADSTLDFYLDRGLNVINYRNSSVTPESACTFTYTEGWLDAV